MDKFSHFDEQGRSRMVDVSEKEDTKRIAVAKGEVKVSAKTLELIKDDEIEKGDVLEVARVAGIMGVKKTPDLIPMCHPLAVSGIDIEFKIIDTEGIIEIIATTKITAKTGVEMESLTAVSTAALTIYDMCKAVDKAMEIGEIKLLKKTGGKSGTYLSDELVGKIAAIYRGDERGQPKEKIESVTIQQDYGLEGDIHAQTGKHQVSLLAVDSVTKYANPEVELGTFEANIITEGIDLFKLQLGTKLKLGSDIILEIKQIGKDDQRMEDHYLAMYQEGIFARVLEGGELKTGDRLEVLL
ncbi:cyclic pyranopterin monophosphate synthase MoaC [Halanaerobacter jeridensis]|uniref:Cyclic pyranopterin monophosphate synthase n=1 Tax=Halanaerobacter jeridensis TaxID=706427 RepID=A0A938XTN6_9FIRM|nr:cyclic pyranopterin monophosphate synthase MoaC [Halanaerobacter jeridensis]MBM7557669.1 cyclic pyranopterin phosphate synthase [Halanaerobacter jeridensis]